MTASPRVSFAAAFLAVGFMLHCSKALGQDAKYEDLTIEEALQFCAAFDDDAERLACFEALAETARSGKNAVPLAQSAPDSDAPEAPQDVAEIPTADQESAPKALAESKDEKSDGADSSASKPRFTFVRSSEAEQKRKKRKRYELTVYRAWRNAVGELRIAFTNGEIWAQADRGTRHTPQPGETIVFKPGILGGWTLSMVDGRYGMRARHVNKKE